jgi:hypothetical protein
MIDTLTGDSGRRYSLEELEAALPLDPGAASQKPSATIIALPGTPPAVMSARVSRFNAAAQANMPAQGRFDALSAAADRNRLLRAIATHPAVIALADSGRAIWLRLLFAFAAAAYCGATEARQIALEWCKTSNRFISEADFDKDWRSFTPGKPGGVTVGTLFDAAAKAGFDFAPWWGAETTTVVQPAPTGNRLVLTSATLDPAELDPVTWLVVGLLLGGELTVIAGMGGSAKTALAIYIAVALAAGRQYVGPFRVNGRPDGLRVIVISSEEDRNRLNLLIAAAANILALSATERARVPHNLQLCDAAESGWQVGAPRADKRESIAPEGEDRAVNELGAVLHGVDLVIFDTSSSLLALPSELDNQAITTLMRRLTRVLRQHNCAGLLLAHTPKLTREQAAALRGEASLVRGGGAFVNASRISLSVTTPPDAEGAMIIAQGLDPKAGRWLEHVKVNDVPLMEPAYFRVTATPVRVRDGTEHSVRAIEFVAAPSMDAASISDAYRNVAMKAIADGGTDKYGATVPLSPSGAGRENTRDANTVIGQALMAANSMLTAAQAKGLAQKVLENLMKIGCVVSQPVQVPKYKVNGAPSGTQTRQGLVARPDLAPWAVQPKRELADADPSATAPVEDGK